MENQLLIKEITNWAKDKGILDKGDPKTQLLKTVSEYSELALHLHSVPSENWNDEQKTAIMDDIGDIFVTLVSLSELIGFPLNNELVSLSIRNNTRENTDKLNDGFFSSIIGILITDMADPVVEEQYDAVAGCILLVIAELNNLSQGRDITLASCVQQAYDEIKDRTGEMVNGTFIDV